jgi:DNA-directed RNA polymerase beta' subunit
MIGNGRASTTERVLVDDDGLINRSLLKIQSSPLGKPWGSAFDGDEMNLHVPQSYSSSVELQELAAVPYQIISPAKNEALIQLVQDTLLGYYVITHDDIYIDKRDMMNILMGVPNFGGVLPKPAKVEDKKEYWTGKQLISIGLPKINMNTGKVIIENGELIKGRINKGASNKIIQIVYNDFGPKVCQEYLDNIQNIVTRFLVKHGFSIGVSDLIISDDIRRQIQDIIVNGKKQVLDLEKKIHLNILTDIKRNVHETFENKTLEILNKTTKQIEDMYKKQLKDDNRAILMKDAGSKGKDMNIRQMSTHLGQQKVQGKRVPIGYTDRTLPHYYRYDSDVISRGFVENSFMDGLTPQESFFHAMGGREGLIDTAVKTSESGYIQRKLIKAMEDLKIFHDSTVRNANGDIVQFLYGYDGIDASGGIEGNQNDLATDKYAELKNKFYFKENENWETFMSKSAIKKMKQTKNWHKKLEDYFNMLMTDRDKLFEVFNYTSNSNMEFLKCPFNAERIINNTIQTLKIREDGLSDLSPIDVIEAVDELCNKLTINGFPNFNFNLTVKTKLAPKQVIFKYRLTKLSLAHVINVIIMKFNESIVQAGEMVGMLAAQSLGETSTQLTLNSIIGEEKILIQENGINNVVEIGKWIDSKLEQNKDMIQHIPENRTQYLELKEKVLIPSCDMDGKTGWHELTAVTKHLPVGDLVKITTKSGRSVTATQAKSFLVYDDKTGKLIKKNGSDIANGDRVPITFQLDNINKETTQLDLSQYLSKKEWLYDNEYNAFYDTPTDKIKTGVICPKICRNVCSTIPEKIELNQQFGFIVGLYLAEGWATNTFIGISNNNETIQKIVYDCCDSINTTCHTVVTESKRFENSTTGDINIHSVTLARLFKKWLDNGSSNKIVPPEAYTASDDFVRGLLDGYISADGKVSKKDGSVIVSSDSEELILGISHLMGRFGIFGIISNKLQQKNNVRSKKIKREYQLSIRNGFAQKLAFCINSSHPDKAKLLKEITLNKNYRHKYGKNYDILNNVILDMVIDVQYINNTDQNDNMINVYDVTVPSTLNFTVFSALNCDDTFHQAGAGATVTTQGVPRLRELLSNTKNMSTPSSTLFLDEDSRYSLEKALEVKYNIEITTIRDIVVSCSIYNDPDNKFKSVIEEDKNILEIYKVFHEIDENCRDMKSNPWVLRFKFNRSKMMERKISMDNIYQVITQSYTNAVCTYSDDNSNDLIFRIRLDFVASTEKADDDIKHLKKIENKILDLVVKGIDNIDGSHISDYNISLVKDELGNYTTKSERQLTTDGSNLVELININNVDPNRCFSNDINEIYNLYGIEAARNVLYNEFNMIFSSEDVNFRHIAMLCDIMTNQGVIMSIDRHGINRGNNGPLAKCSFEEAVDQLQKAAIHGDRDNLSGVSANVMMGQLPPSGTGDSTLILDELKLVETQNIEKPENDIDIDEILNVSDYCQENVGIKFNINKIKKKNINVKNIPKVKPE